MADVPDPVGVTWLGHATAVIETRGARFLTDPLLRMRLAHITRRAAAVERQALEDVDAILISHVHRDHLDLPSLRSLDPAIPIVVPRGAGRFIRGREVHELAAGETLRLGGADVTATAATHRAARGGRIIPCLGYLVADDVYFAGDTDLFASMADLAPLKLVLLPVWGYGLSLGPGHLDPLRAAKALTLLRPEVAVPIHWGTFFPAYRGLRGHHLLTQPPVDFARHAAVLAPDVRVVILQPGGRVRAGGA